MSTNEDDPIPPTQSPTSPAEELAAMTAVSTAVGGLDPAATARVLGWAAERFGVTIRGKGHTVHHQEDRKSDTTGDDAGRFAAFAELFDAVGPKTEADKALVAGYWFQFHEKQDSLAARTLNTALKDLGQGISNITNALEALKAQSPALVLQLKKSGTSAQAQKTYKVTIAGKKAVEQMIGQARRD